MQKKARQAPKSRRQLLAANREQGTKLEYNAITIKNLTTQRDEALAGIQAAVKETDQADRMMHEMHLSFEGQHGHNNGVINGLVDELVMLLRSSMRKDGMAFEDIDRVIHERQFPMREFRPSRGCGCKRCRSDRHGGGGYDGGFAPDMDRRPLRRY